MELLKPSAVGKFGGAILHHIFRGLPVLNDEEYNKRLEVCRTCDKSEQSTTPWTCKECGCYLQEHGVMPGKARWASQNCPLGKWPALTPPLAQQGPQPEAAVRSDCNCSKVS